LSGWFGGPSLCIAKKGHPRLRMRRAPYAIGTVERDEWMLCMTLALTEQVADVDFRNRCRHVCPDGEPYGQYGRRPCVRSGLSPSVIGFMAVEHVNLWLWLGLGGALLALPLGARALLLRGLAPEATLEGVQPVDLGLAAQSVCIPAAGRLSLFAWYLPPRNATKPAPAVVLLHGWGGNASTLLPAAQTLHQAGYAVLLPESRNQGSICFCCQIRNAGSEHWCGVGRLSV